MATNHFTLSNLTQIARQTMLEKGLSPDFSPQAMDEVENINAPAPATPITKDQRGLLWCSIDNDDSKDLDQLTYAEKVGNDFKLYISVADVTAIVKPGMAINQHAEQNTTTVYTPTQNFSMIPEKLSTDLTSLNGGADRLSVVVEVLIGPDGVQKGYDVYSSMVHNYAKLAYNSVSKWLNNQGDMPDAIKAVNGMDEQLRLQDAITQILVKKREADGSLYLHTIETHALIENDRIVDLVETNSDRANQLIENFMICANGAVTQFLNKNKSPVLRRIVRTPKYWNKIVQVASDHGYSLPAEPDSKALETFLCDQLKKDPVRFPDLSLTIIKLLGRGEYFPQFPGQDSPGHFGLAVRQYSHTTAPNRRYPDIINQRLVKAVLYKEKVPYADKDLIFLAKHCSEQEEAAEKVARKLNKCAAAVYLQDSIGKTFDGIVTGVNEKGTWVRVFKPPVEGKLVQNGNLQVGNRVKVKLVSVDPQNGFIDFAKV